MELGIVPVGLALMVCWSILGKCFLGVVNVEKGLRHIAQCYVIVHAVFASKTKSTNAQVYANASGVSRRSSGVIAGMMT